VAELKGIDLVLLDPPRAGLQPAARKALQELGAAEIIYVSCDPSTLARDLKQLCAAGYTLQDLRAFDLFPQTYHIEAVAVLSKTS
jgi:23S rRNA (uracil1939-C5)-methyltransferase